MSPRGKRVTPLRALFRLLLLVLVIYGVVLGLSANKIYGKFEHIQEEYASYEKAIDKFDLDAAMVSVRSMADDIAIMEDEANSWQWNLASHVPVWGEDVVCVQRLLGIADSLANDALLPTLAKVEAATEDPSLSRVGEVVDALTHARSVVNMCYEEANALPTSHFEGLNEVVDKTKEIIQTVNETFEKFSLLLDVANVFTK